MKEGVMSSRTIFISRLLGLYCLIASLTMFTQKPAIVEIENTIVHNPAMLFIAGIITLVAGLAIVLSHNVWSGGALPVLVTVFGWLQLIKGFLCLFLSPQAAVGFWGAFHYEQFFYLYVTIIFILGAYLTYAGFTSLRFPRFHQHTH
jgi:hypothetical protein